MNKKFVEMFENIMEINKRGDYTIFFNLSPHVKGFDILIYEKEWKSGDERLFFSFYYHDEAVVYRCAEFIETLVESKISNFKEILKLSNACTIRDINHLDLIELERGK